MKLLDYLKKLASAPTEERISMLETINMQNYASNILSETDMWILTSAVENTEYLASKLKEAEELSLDTEAPAEGGDELSLDEPAETGGDELSLDVPSEGGDELSLDEPTDTPAEGGDELALDTPAEGGDELSLDKPAETASEETTTDEEPAEEKQEIETSLEGAGLLPLIADIQDKLANGKPSEIELAALKAMKKLF